MFSMKIIGEMDKIQNEIWFGGCLFKEGSSIIDKGRSPLRPLPRGGQVKK